MTERCIESKSIGFRQLASQKHLQKYLTFNIQSTFFVLLLVITSARALHLFLLESPTFLECLITCCLRRPAHICLPTIPLSALVHV
jgi:hypothetical protein